jgi:hypothetical protein
LPCKAILKRLMCAADEDPTSDEATKRPLCSAIAYLELELELIHTQMAKKPKIELGPILSRKLWEREGSGRRVAHRKVRVKMGFWVQGKNPRAFVQFGLPLLWLLGRRTVELELELI